MGTIRIEDMEFFARHGHFEEEQKIGRKFTLNLSMETDFDKAAETDDLEGTVNYAAVYEVIKAEMEQPSKLLEHVGNRIANTIKEQFPAVKSLELKIAKNNPPINGKAKNVSIIIRK